MPTTDDKAATAATTPHYETGPIVIGSDGSPGGEDAVALGHDLLGTSNRRLVAEKVPGVVAPSLGLVGLAEREDAGTLVVGSPHRGPVGRALLGSVAHHVLHHAPCEVVVAARGYAGRERRPRIAKAVLKAALADVAPSIEADGETLDPGWRQADKTIAKGDRGGMRARHRHPRRRHPQAARPAAARLDHRPPDRRGALRGTRRPA
jgi:hypothetical protein